ncbi:cupin domain-containing protein [Sphingomonas sp. CJ20]
MNERDDALRAKVAVANLLAPLPTATHAEAFTELLARPGVRIERIVSRGQSTPEDAPMVQDSDEWVLLVEGAAGIRIEDSDVVTLKPGDHLWIERGRKHWVAWTASDRATIWLAVHLD